MPCFRAQLWDECYVWRMLWLELDDQASTQTRRVARILA
jgi:hypothetical protein